MSRKTYEMDMTSGPILGKIIRFAIPVMLSGILQLLFNAADIIVVGQFAGSDSLAALSPTGSLSNLMINLFIGLSVGTNVLVAHYYGANQKKDVEETVHTSVAISLIAGFCLVIIGVTLCRPLLELMDTPEEVIDRSAIYMKIYFAGMPVVMLYNFGSAILRAIGDTRRPLYFLSIAGVINVVLNLIFVIVFHMDVAGVALATIISQAFSAVMVVRCLMKDEGICHLELKRVRIVKEKLIRMARIGLPAGLQGAVFSISNVLIQSSVNSFGANAMAGNTAAGNIEGFVYNAMNAFYQTNLSFTSQNYGAKKYERIPKITFYSLGMVAVIGFVLGGGAYLASGTLLRIYTDVPEVIRIGQLRMKYVAIFYLFCGMMDTLVGSVRGLGYSVLPMIVSLTGACLFRVIYIYTIFAMNRTLDCLYVSYPISWALTASVHFICLMVIWRKKLNIGNRPTASQGS
ncbi:MAG: MATE family efflux transporter [Lachnospiraceae bacterium]|nr:MATE family efflux transporter [Lachnospiraceae bacterium]